MMVGQLGAVEWSWPGSGRWLGLLLRAGVMAVKESEARFASTFGGRIEVEARTQRVANVYIKKEYIWTLLRRLGEENR